MLNLINDSAAVIIGATTLSFTFLFIYYSEGMRYLLLWAAGWGINAVAVLFRSLPMLAPGMDYFISVSLVLNYLSSVFIGLGIHYFVYGNKPSAKLNAIIFPSTLLPALLFPNDPEHAAIAVVFTFAGSVFLLSGLVLIRKIKGIGSKIAGASFIAWGLIMFLTMIMHDSISIASPTMRFTSFITLLSALGIVMMHFEKMRCELETTTSLISKLTETSKDIVFSVRLNPALHVTYVSRSVLSLLGYTPQEIIDDDNLLNKIVDKEAMDNLRNIAVGKDIKSFMRDSAAFTAKNGKVLTFDLNQTVVMGLNGKPESIIGIARDITDKAMKIDRLASEKTWYELIFKRSNIMTMLVDSRSMTIIESNYALSSFYCCPHESMQGMHIRKLFADDEDYLDFLNSCDEAVPFQCRNLLPDSTYVYVTMHSSPMFLDGKPYMFVTVLDNTSENYLAFELSSIKNLHKSILESLNEGVIGINKDGIVFFINKSAAETLGYQPEELLYTNHHDTIHSRNNGNEHPESECSILKCLRTGGTMRSIRETLVHKDGRLLPVVFNFSTLRSDSGSGMGVLVFRDITEELKSEETILHSLEENKVLLKELHHRVKNNFQMICSLLSLHADDLPESEEKDFLNESVTKILSMALTHELLFETNSFSKLGSKQYLERMINHLHHSSWDTERISVIKDIEDIGLSLDEAVPCALIVNELFTNAVKYAKKGGDRLEIFIRFYLDGDEKMLIFCDNGIGIQRAEDFGKKSSYGLMIIKSLTRQLKGSIIFENRNGLCVTLRYR